MKKWDVMWALGDMLTYAGRMRLCHFLSQTECKLGYIAVKNSKWHFMGVCVKDLKKLVKTALVACLWAVSKKG